ncbi:MAG: arginine deiminase family protein [Chloroflexota bacterium]|nr:arginine deiminase family protein [Chloroflexota bacterium]
MVNKALGALWTDEEIKQAIDEWRQKRPERVKTGDWRVEDVPFYEKGRLPRVDLWHRVDYLDEYDLTYGKKWGASGLGKLREVAVVRPSDGDLHPFDKQDPVFMNRPVHPNLKKWQEEHDNFVQILRDNGVTVHYIEYPKPAIGPYGPIRGLWAGKEVEVVWGGAIVTKYGGWNVLNHGREKVLTEWLVKQGCPILLTIIGKGVVETGPIMVLADDAILVPRGMACNEDGVAQMRPVLERVGIPNIVEVYTVGWMETTDWYGGGAYHADMFMMPIDIGKMLICPRFCGWETVKQLRAMGYELIEIGADDQKNFIPSNLICLEPGKVMMHAGAKETISKVRKAGVEVVEVPFTQNICMGGGIYCCTAQLVRDRGPKLADMK